MHLGFDNGKTITTGEGGMITTNNREFYKLCKEYMDHGHENNPKFQEVETHTGYQGLILDQRKLLG